MQFNKLERVEIGGSKGKTLTVSVRQIFSDFQAAVAKFQAVQYNILDVESKNFDDDFYDFRCVIKVRASLPPPEACLLLLPASHALPKALRVEEAISIPCSENLSIFGKFQMLLKFGTCADHVQARPRPLDQ